MCFFHRKHYREYLVSLINIHSLDPAVIYDVQELTRACQRYQVDMQRGENEEDKTYYDRLLMVRHLSLPPHRSGLVPRTRVVCWKIRVSASRVPFDKALDCQLAECSSVPSQLSRSVIFYATVYV